MTSIQKYPTILLIASLVTLAGCSAIQRKLLFYPTHHKGNNGLTAWTAEGKTIGYSRQVPVPKNIWLMLHGNGGQATDRVYAIPSFSDNDSIFILEYPGYGAREGEPARETFDAAAIEAYLLLRRTFPDSPVCVVGESIGSGPASALASQVNQPDKIVLIVPFDTLKSVASDHFSYLPVGMILGKSWDNVQSLSTYKGQVEIFGADQDTVIPITHAERLSSSTPGSKFHRIPGGHNDWWQENKVEIRNP